ncbi:MAG: hypothetical protein PHI34_03220 [Acidobacteriota bacterium]|nr:hypothetical protein [Acidobacteriota bacterium]
MKKIVLWAFLLILAAPVVSGFPAIPASLETESVGMSGTIKTALAARPSSGTEAGLAFGAALAAPTASTAEAIGVEDVLDPQTPDEKAFQEVKILIFDQKWTEAASRLDDFLTRYPKSGLVPQAVYYRGKCLEEKGGRERDALRAYRDFLQYRDQNRNLVEDAEVSIVDLALTLYSRGDQSAWDDLEVRLTHPSRSVRQYAALQISTLKDKSKAEMAVPILLFMAEKETNLELRDRAKIALLRIAPERLSAVEDEPRHERRARMIKFEFIEDGKATQSLALPWALADLILSAISDKDKEAMRREGYDIPRIMHELESGKGKGVDIRVEGGRIRIWLE